MAGFTTTNDLVANALWLAGEPTDGTSDYQTQSLTWMQLIYDTLVNGGTIGTRDLATSAGLYQHVVDIPTTDYMWLRKYPPAAFNTTPAILGSGAAVSQSSPAPAVIGSIAVTYGSDAFTFSTAPFLSTAPSVPVSVATWRFKMLNQAMGVSNPPITVPRVLTHSAGSLTGTFDATWPQETQTVSNFVLFQGEYSLPDDFVRFCESPSVQGGWMGQLPPRLAVGNTEQVEDQFPLQSISQGPPTAAARISPSVLQMNRWDTQSYRIEFSYVFTPPVLTVSADPPQQPIVPQRFRHILAVGSAMMITQDKVDGRSSALASQFREIVLQIGQEYRKEQMMGSELAGRHLYRQGQNRRGMLRSASGFPIW